MLLLDTDHLSVLEWGGADSLSLQLRLGQIDPTTLATTIITYEEQMRGWLARAAQANTSEKMLLSYSRLERHIEIFRDMLILPFDRAAISQFEHLQQQKIRIGTMDLKIAAICLAREATLLTRNFKDFRQVPNLNIEDWTE